MSVLDLWRAEPGFRVGDSPSHECHESCPGKLPIVSPDGTRFAFVVTRDLGNTPIDVILNWTANWKGAPASLTA